MREIFKKIFLLAVLAGVIYGGYRAYKKLWSEGIVTKNGKKASVFLEKIGKAVKSRGEEYMSQADEALIKKPAEKVKDYAAEKTAAALVAVEKKLEEAAAALTNKNPSPVSSHTGTSKAEDARGEVTSVPNARILQKPGAMITVALNASLALALHGGENASSYTIDWGDGKVEKDSIDAGATKSLTHAWLKKGEYVVMVTFEEQGEATSVSLPVQVE